LGSSPKVAIESLTVWDNWEAVYQPASRLSTLIRVVEGGPWVPGTVGRFGSDAVRLDVVAVRAEFGANRCDWGWPESCIDFQDGKAAAFYAEHTAAMLVPLLRESVIKAEADLNKNLQWIQAQGFGVVAWTGGPSVGAASYGHRATLSGAKRCLRCQASTLGQRYSTAQLGAAATPDGQYAMVSNWGPWFGYEGVGSGREELRANIYKGDGVDGDATKKSYWLWGSPERCRDICSTAGPECVGFLYRTAGEYSCGLKLGPRKTQEGECAELGLPAGDARSGQAKGACFFMAELGSLQYHTTWVDVMGPEEENAFNPNDCGIHQNCKDTYFKTGPGFASARMAQSEAAQLCGNDCQFFYGEVKGWAPGTSKHKAWELDGLLSEMDALRRMAHLEQQLEDRLIDATRRPEMQDIILDFLERWRAIGGELFVGADLIKPPSRCLTGGKGCGHRAVMANPDDDASPFLKALQAYAVGNRSALPFTVNQASAAELAAQDRTTRCDPPCQWGACEVVSSAASVAASVASTATASYDMQCECFAGYTGAACNVSVHKNGDCHGPHHTLGIGLSGLADWSTQWDFVDVSRKSRSWNMREFASSQGGGASLPVPALASDGFPRSLAPNQRAEAMMLRDLDQHYVSGWYHVVWDGDGTVTFGLEAKQVRYPAPNMAVVDVQLSTGVNNGLTVSIDRTNPTDPVRNLRVITPGHEHGQRWVTSPFHPAFLDRLRKFKVLRFMDWMHANVATSGNWTERPTAATASYAWSPGGGGAPVEAMVRLSNQLGTDPWFTIGVDWDDHYVEEFAKIVRDTLRPDVTIYVEVANEMWHNMFHGGQVAQVEALRQDMTRECWVVARTRHVSKLWQGVFGPVARRRLKFVVQVQFGNFDSLTRTLACDTGVAGEDVDAIGIAPYFNGCNVDTSVSVVVSGSTASAGLLADAQDRDGDGEAREVRGKCSELPEAECGTGRMKDWRRDRTACASAVCTTSADSSTCCKDIPADGFEAEKMRDAELARVEWVVQQTTHASVAVATLTLVDKVIQSFRTEINTTATSVRQYFDTAQARGFVLFAYESGPSGTGSGGEDDVCMAAHRDPRMEHIIEEYYDALSAAGIHTLMHFASCGKPSKYGSWGAIEATDQVRC
jgi:hypothetical protein